MTTQNQSNEGINSTLVELIKRYIAGDELQKAADKELKRLRADQKIMSARISELMAVDAVTQLKIDGVTAYVRTNRYVSKVAGIGMEDACEYLKGAGLDYMVKPAYSPASLKSFVGDVIGEGHDLPNQFETWFNVYEEDAIGLRRS